MSAMNTISDVSKAIDNYGKLGAIMDDLSENGRVALSSLSEIQESLSELSDYAHTATTVWLILNALAESTGLPVVLQAVKNNGNIPDTSELSDGSKLAATLLKNVQMQKIDDTDITINALTKTDKKD